jgi:hypothetical protein
VVACPDAHAFGVDDRREVVRMHVVEPERHDAAARFGIHRPVDLQPLDL